MKIIDLSQSLYDHMPVFPGDPEVSIHEIHTIELEKLLLKHNIISCENLIHTDELPSKFMFYGVPLNIKDSDGSPVRAFAIIE
jgi:kynurenine formamidase